MHKSVLSLAALSALVGASPTNAHAQTGQREVFDYWQHNRAIVWRGMQALFMCHGLFESDRSPEQVFRDELAYLPEPVGTVDGGDYLVDKTERVVAVGADDGVPVMRAVHRPGVGCMTLAPDQSVADIVSLPKIDMPPVPGDPATIDWPDGDRVPPVELPGNVSADRLQAASDWAFDRESPEQVTLSLLIVHNGNIIHERYADGVDLNTRTRTWSTAKSIAATLIGMAVDDGLLALDEPLPVRWLPGSDVDGLDPRADITLRHVLNMSSGLMPVDNNRREYATGSGLAYWAGASSVRMAREGALVRKPGTHWDYENLDTLACCSRAARGSRRYHGLPHVRAPPSARPDRHAQYRAWHGSLRRFHSEQPGLHERTRSRAIRSFVP